MHSETAKKIMIESFCFILAVKRLIINDIEEVCEDFLGYN